MNKPLKRDRTPGWVVGYAVYLCLLGLRRASRAVSLFLPRSREYMWRWIHRFRSLSGAFYAGRARTAIVDEGTVNLRGLEAWI
ncbi:MAG: hypothetical protein QW186_05095 [Candidatus Bathyarchaeia archaeon]